MLGKLFKKHTEEAESSLTGYNLERFLKAQEFSYSQACEELKRGHKQTHWMWYIFPQIDGLGYSTMDNMYSIKSMEEAKAYIMHPVLGKRLREISQVLIDNTQNDASRIFGYPDDLKLRSCMTLFLEASGEGIFQKVLDKFYEGKKDEATLVLLENTKEEMDRGE